MKHVTCNSTNSQGAPSIPSPMSIQITIFALYFVFLLFNHQFLLVSSQVWLVVECKRAVVWFGQDMQSCNKYWCWGVPVEGEVVQRNENEVQVEKSSLGSWHMEYDSSAGFEDSSYFGSSSEFGSQKIQKLLAGSSVCFDQSYKRRLFELSVWVYWQDLLGLFWRKTRAGI